MYLLKIKLLYDLLIHLAEHFEPKKMFVYNHFLVVVITTNFQKKKGRRTE